MNTKVRHPSDAELHAFNGGALVDTSLDAVSVHLDECSDCRGRLREVAMSDRVLPWLRRVAKSDETDPICPAANADHGQPTTIADSKDTTDPAHGTSSLPSIPTIPGYEIDGVLGRGAMGVVYKARHRTLKRTVALKMVLTRGHAGPRELARFRIEAEAVARLQHPNIVQIHEIGETDNHPYCALEFVEGGNLASQIDGKPISPREAAKLVGTLARAMQLAHSRNVVHRDLKPANILLAADGTPKITDFGLARQLDSDSGETQEGAVMGTPSYMAPEQASGNAHEAGPAADVYALGAILYDCLTGRPPFKGKTVVETLDLVRTQGPVPPSRLQPSVPLDLETICLKCLRKEPEDRYASAAELANELGRYELGEPILARPVGRIERAVKWVKRNKTLTGAALAVVLALAGGTTASYLKYLDAEQQKNIAENRRKEADRQTEIAEERRKDAVKQTEIAEERRKDAELQKETAQAVSEFLGGLFEDADPIARTGRMFGARNRGEGVLTALEVVDRGALKLKTALTGKPRVRASLLDRIGNVYLDLGRAKEAAPLLYEAMRLRRQEFGPDHPEVATSLQSLGLLHLSVGEMALAGTELEQALALRRKHLGENHPLVADTLFHLATQRMILYEFRQAEQRFQECLTIRRNHFGKENREVAIVLLMLGQTLMMNDDTAKALPLLNEAAALIDRLEGNNDFSAIISLFTRAQFAHRLGNAKQARALYQEADAKAVRLLGEEHYLVNFSRGMFAGFLNEQREYEASAKVLRGVVANFRKSFGPDALILTGRLITLARVERNLNRVEEAEAAARDAVRIHRKHSSQRPDDQKNRAACLHVLASLVYQRGEVDEADTFYREGLAIQLRRGLIAENRTQEMARQLAVLRLRREDVPSSPKFSTHTKAVGKPEIDVALAQNWAQAAQALARRPLPPAADDEIIFEYFQKQAVVMLRSAAASGMRDVEMLQRHADFKTLHARADFQELVRELKKTPPQVEGQPPLPIAPFGTARAKTPGSVGQVSQGPGGGRKQSRDEIDVDAANGRGVGEDVSNGKYEVTQG